MKDYRQTLGSFDADGNFEGGRIVYRRTQGEIEGTLFCQMHEDESQEWFIVQGWTKKDSATQSSFTLSRESQIPLSETQLESITRGKADIYFLEDQKNEA